MSKRKNIYQMKETVKIHAKNLKEAEEKARVMNEEEKDRAIRLNWDAYSYVNVDSGIVRRNNGEYDKGYYFSVTKKGLLKEDAYLNKETSKTMKEFIKLLKIKARENNVKLGRRNILGGRSRIPVIFSNGIEGYVEINLYYNMIVYVEYLFDGRAKVMLSTKEGAFLSSTPKEMVKTVTRGWSTKEADDYYGKYSR